MNRRVADRLATLDAAVDAYARHTPAVLRIGLGVVILLAGLHKLVDPGAWAVYAAPAFASRWPLPLDPTMVAFGLSEVPFGLALIADRYATLAAAVVAASMLGVVVNLVVALVQTGRFADVLVRDVGLFVLATGVTLQSAAGEGN